MSERIQTIKEIFPGLDFGVPRWTENAPNHRVEIAFYPQEIIERVVAEIRTENPFLFPQEHEYGDGSGQKKVEADKWIELPRGIEAGKGGVIYDENGRPYVVKHPDWWKEKDAQKAREGGFREIPDYAVYPIGVVRRDLKEEEQVVELPTEPEATGCELEFGVGIFTPFEVVPLNIQHVIKALKEAGIPASIEGWVSQFEHPSKPRRKEMDLEEHKRELVRDLLAIAVVLEKLGARLIPTGVMPYSSLGQPNFENTHVRKVLVRGMSAALGRELTIKEAAEILSEYAVNGLHITVNLKEDKNGFVGDERLKEVFELTHTPMSILLKALTLNGNLESVEALVSGRLSYRDLKRLKLPTAQVGIVRRLYDEETIRAVEEGVAPSLERASLCDEKGDPAAGVHNPSGRKKEVGRNEFTAFDVEPNVDKILSLEALLSVYTTMVDRVLLEKGNKEEAIAFLSEGLTEGRKKLFLSFLSSQEEFLKYSKLVEEEGIKGVLKVNGEELSVGKVILEFIDWVEEKAKQVGILDDRSEEVGYLEFLRNIINKQLQGQMAANFEEYLNPESELYGVGTVSEIARKRFEELTSQGLDQEQVRIQIVKELSEAYHQHLKLLFDKLNQAS